MQNVHMSILKMANPIQQYHWGSRQAIAEIQGRPVPTDQPEAELWMGTHPKAPSFVVRQVTEAGHSSNRTSLIDVLREQPDLIGKRAPELLPPGETEPGLPFLFKILAAEKALSIQAHPDLARAAAGFDRDEAAGIEASAAERNYRDRNHKPELICALSDFYGMAGFRQIGRASCRERVSFTV